MKKYEIKATIKDNEKNLKLYNAFFRYDPNYWNLIPLKSGDDLFLSAKDDDFILDGFTVRRFKDLVKVELVDSKYTEILKIEKVTEGLTVPFIDLSSWQTVFDSLELLGNNIIVEKESLDKDEWEFAIGRIERIYNKFVYVRHFDADGIWQDEPLKIPYTQITSVTFASRYVDVFSKYLGPLPENFYRKQP